MIKALVFDLDGTLIDSNEAHAMSWVVAYRLAGYGNVPVGEVRKYLGARGDLITESVLGKDALKDYRRIRVIKDRVFLRLVREGIVKTFPEVHYVLRELRRYDIRICLATSTSVPTLLTVLEFFNLMDYFDAIVAGEEVPRSKPEPDLFLEALRRVRVEPDNGIIVGDTLFDMIPAKKIGALAVLIRRPNERSNGMHSHELDVHPDIILDNLSELISVIRDKLPLA